MFEVQFEEGVKDLKKIVDTEHESGVTVIGCVSTPRTLFRGSPVDMKKEAFTCLESEVDVLAPGYGLAPETLLKNLKALVEARNEFYGRR
ncbi:TPA: hypothetical protein HA338_13010 [Methanosarcina acetivorans]|uniref:Uroporphyrinogen decarboxylase (URO-D) domain-containing protein n=2 Tax=Methanosarcina acetivorans TaxID=2214 RepID=Q8TNU0_METAC|nr:uroporphyrinogen decarboxylase family protein [Methanosarcina acetivorans]AAM05586.1 hypothetical protein MA_2190 [Methanosarcina acetivorans C2A]HIH94890.1 hypothetical protein [Methanosarcina acetivorans]